MEVPVLISFGKVICIYQIKITIEAKIYEQT